MSRYLRWGASLVAVLLVAALPVDVRSEPLRAEAAPGAVDAAGDWPGEPRMIAGAAGYDAGVWSYTDYPYDDRGTGDFAYPQEGPDGAEGEARYGNNAADPVVLRVALGPDAVHYLVGLNTLIEADTTVVSLAVDTDVDEATGGGEWPLDAKLDSPGWEHVVTAWGTGGLVTTHDGDTHDVPVAANTALNRIEVAVPYEIADPAGGVWRYRAAAGVWDPEAGQWAEVQGSADDPTRPSGKDDPDQPNAFNLLFRNRIWDGGTEASDENGSPGFQFARQSEALSAGEIGDFSRDIDFSVLASGETVHTPEPRADHNFTRVYATEGWPNDLPEGVSGGTNAVGGNLYNGRYQPYILFVPESYWAGEGRAPLMPLLHGWTQNHRGFNPSDNDFWNDVVRANRALVPKPLGRGEEVWYEHVGELDVLEVMADVARHYEIDRDRIYLGGVSMGGLGTIKIAEQHPDLFAGILPSVPPMSDRAQGYAVPENNDWDLAILAASLRNVPVRNFFGTIDVLVPAGVDPQRFCDALYELVYDHDCWREVLGGHTSYNNPRAAEIGQLLDTHELVRDPARVTYVSHPVFRRQAAEAGIDDVLGYESVYWVSGLRYPEPPADDLPVPDWPTDPGTPRRLTEGEGLSMIDVRTYGRGEGDPVAEEIPDDPSPTTVRSGWRLHPGEGVPARNHFELTWEDVLAADLDLASMGLKLNPGHALTAKLTRESTAGPRDTVTGGPADLVGDPQGLELGLLGAPPAAVDCTATIDGEPAPVTRDGRRLVVEVDIPPDEAAELVVSCGR